MKKMKYLAGTAFLMLALLTMPAFAAQDQQNRNQGYNSNPGMMGSVTTNAARDHFSASKIMGKNLLDDKGEKLGEISDLMIGPDGRVIYAVVSHGGVVGVGDTLTPVPWKAIKETNKKDEFFVKIDKDRFAKAPSFKSDSWPSMADSNWQNKVFSYYGQGME